MLKTTTFSAKIPREKLRSTTENYAETTIIYEKERGLEHTYMNNFPTGS